MYRACQSTGIVNPLTVESIMHNGAYTCVQEDEMKRKREDTRVMQETYVHRHFTLLVASSLNISLFDIYFHHPSSAITLILEGHKNQIITN